MAELEHETSHLAHVMRDMKNDFEFAIGMVFSNELEAYHKYVAYAIDKGFGVRKGHTVKNRKGEITRRTLLCNCEGYSVTPSDQEKKFERLEVRCGCLAHIKFKVDNGIYEVIEYVSEHNHAFVSEDQKHLIRCGKMISDTVVVDIIKAGIGGTTAHKFLADEAGGGSKNSGLCQKILQTESNKDVDWRDYQNLLNHFNCMQMQNPMFFYAVQVDQDGRLTNLFWRDSLSKFDYHCFGDVLVFDSTYRTNRNNLICAPFVGVNHHWKNTLFGCAFLLDETAESFTWLFDVFLESMGNKAPKTIFTDQDQAMAKAIRRVFPNTHHRLCPWHIIKNANQNIPQLYHKSGFRDKYFLRLMYRCKSEDEFESTWMEMEEEWGTQNNNWLQRLYGLRHKWSSAFGRDIFLCDIWSSQRSESTNNVFQHISKKTSSLVQFVHYYEEQLNHMRETEIQDDYNSRGKPKLQVSYNGILIHAASVYTRTIFQKFNEEFLECLSEQISGITFDGSVYLYTIRCMGNRREHLVKFNPVELSISCECKLFESKGWLCRHALHVLNKNISVVKSIPSSYILKRWTKGAKEGIVNDESLPPGPSKFDRFATLMQESFELMILGAKDVNTMQIVRENMKIAKDQISSYKSSIVVTDDAGDDSDNEDSLCDISVLDPIRRKGKRINYEKIKSSSEKQKKKSIKGTPPMQIDNRELVFQATHKETHFPNHLSNLNQFQSIFYPSNIGGSTVNFNNQMQQPPYIMPSGIMNGFCQFPNQMQSSYIMPPSNLNGFSPFTSQMLEYNNRSHGTILSQGSSNSFQHLGMNESGGPSKSTDNAQLQHK